MIVEGTIPMNPAETTAVDTLNSQYNVSSITRRDPQDTGPLIVETGAGDYEVEEDGTVNPIG
jgi:hypothetical protein